MQSLKEGTNASAIVAPIVSKPQYFVKVYMPEAPVGSKDRWLVPFDEAQSVVTSGVVGSSEEVGTEVCIAVLAWLALLKSQLCASHHLL